ncbi:MAG TPA: hypothetical protein VIZ18_12435 [Ktedonobacteraceae bacterium]
MILHNGERVYWGAPEVIYLEGTIVRLDEAAQTVTVRIERATPNSAHLIGEDVPFAADGLTPLQGESPAGITSERAAQSSTAQPMSDEEKLHSAAAVAVYQKYGATISSEQREAMIAQVAQIIASDAAMRARIIESMDQILRRER